MKKERNEYIEQILDLDGDLDGRRAALDFIEQSDVWVHGAPVRFPYVPYLYDAKDLEFIAEQVSMIHGILCKVIARYLEDPEYRKIFRFSEELEKLILLPCGYDDLLPMGRFDLFLDEETLSYKFCEFNTDGSGAMSRDYMIGQALMLGETCKLFAEKHEVRQFELFHTWVKDFIDIYASTENAKPDPVVAITDFRESGVMSDFDRFIQAFKDEGYDARFTDIRDLEFTGEALIDRTDGKVIDAIYRRAVTSEMLQHPGECDGLIDAVAAQKVCLIGHFRTTVVHSKEVNIALFDDRTRAFMTDEENTFIDAHVPRTYRLQSDAKGFSMSEVIDDKDSWIIKPADDYGAHGVFPGVDFNQGEWKKIVEGNVDKGYIVQEFYQPAEVDIINTVVDDDDPCLVEAWRSMPGVYVYRGKPVGFYCRLGNEGVIALDHNGLCSTSFYVD